MLAPRLPCARSLVRCSLVVSAIAAGVWGCQGPDAFFRSGDGAINGSGGAHGGTNGQLGGTTGSGGVTTSTGGVTGGTGGKGMGGMTTSMGGKGMGGMTTSMGGKGMGGMTTSLGGMATSMGGMTTSMGGMTGSGGMPGGTGPCMGRCANPTVITTATFNSGNLGTAATCHETTVSLQGGGCSNCSGRTMSINGTAQTATGNWPSLPAKVNGGYCFQLTAGGLDYASFYTF